MYEYLDGTKLVQGTFQVHDGHNVNSPPLKYFINPGPRRGSDYPTSGKIFISETYPQIGRSKTGHF